MCAAEHYSPDVDNGWAFVVAVAGIVTGIVTSAIPFANSILYAILLDEFEESPVITAWAVNLNFFCTLANAIFANCILLIIGCRRTIVVGCLMSSIGLASCSFVTGIIGILGLYGILTGTGHCFVYLAMYSAIPDYYKKYRIIATAIANAGGGMGHFVITPILQFLIDRYHWRGAFLILGAANLNLLIVAAVLIPPRYPGNEQDEDISRRNEYFSNKEKAIRVIKNLRSYIFLFRCPYWILFCFGRLFLQLNIGGFLTHIYNFGRQPFLQLSLSQITFLPSIVGIGSIVGRLLAGIGAQMQRVSVVFVYTLMASMLVVAGIVISFARNYQGIASSCFFAGLSFGISALQFETIIHIVGIECYSTGLSYAMLIGGMGTLVGGPLAAWIYEMDPSYFWTFGALGSIGFVGVLVNIPVWLTVSDGKVRERLPKDALNREEVKT